MTPYTTEPFRPRYRLDLGPGWLGCGVNHKTSALALKHAARRALRGRQAFAATGRPEGIGYECVWKAAIGAATANRLKPAVCPTCSQDLALPALDARDLRRFVVWLFADGNDHQAIHARRAMPRGLYNALWHVAHPSGEESHRKGTCVCSTGVLG